jgi:hypothetical protein
VTDVAALDPSVVVAVGPAVEASLVTSRTANPSATNLHLHAIVFDTGCPPRESYSIKLFACNTATKRGSESSHVACKKDASGQCNTCWRTAEDSGLQATGED